MSPEMRVRISGQNETPSAFGEVARDAQAAGQAVKASGELAASGLRSEAAALELVHERTRMASFRTQNLAFQLNDLGVQIASGGGILRPLIQQGSQVVGIYGGQGGVRAALGDIAGIVTKFAPIGAALGLVAGGFAGLTYEINKTAKTQVSFGDVVQATFQVAAGAIGKFFQPAISQLGTWFGQFIDWLVPAFKTGVNGIINGFTFAFDAVKDTWATLPAALGDITISTANNVVSGVEHMVNGAIDLINQFTGGARGALKQIGIDVGDIGKVKLGAFDNPFAGAASKTAGIISGDLARDFARDPAGSAFDAISGQAQKLELAAQAADKLSKGLKGANDNAKLLASGLKAVGGVTDLVADSQQKMADTAFGAFGQLTSGLAALFKDNKAFAIANAVVNTAEGITKALAQGGIFGFIGAAGVAAAGAAQIAAIASATPGSASAPSVSASAAAAQASPTAAGSAINLTIRGSGNINVDELGEQLAKSIADGGNSNFVKVIRAA